MKVSFSAARVATSIISALRKRRLKDFIRLDWTSVAYLHLKANCSFDYCTLCTETSSRLIAGNSRDIDGLLGRTFRPTASIIDLDLYDSFGTYRRAVSTTTSGKYPRAANKARKLGYSSRPVGPGAYQRSLYAVRASRPIRSKGLVWEALASPPAGLTDADVKFETPLCPDHWRIDWGAFKAGLKGEEFVAHATLLRSGNMVHVLHFMGHADALADGVMKLLMFDVIAWLLERESVFVRDLKYVVHGTVEEGSKGLSDWKRYFQFSPMRINRDDFTEFAGVRDFDAAAYLELNPDVAKARVDPYLHYVTYGRLEGRKKSRN